MDENLMVLLKNNFKERIIDINEINGGWLTDKWKIKFENFSVILKVIAEKKIKRRDINIELATKLLKKANDFDIKCPHIYLINNKLVNYNKNNNPIVVTEYLEDTFLKFYNDITSDEIFLLGQELSKLRKCFDEMQIHKNVNYEKIIDNLYSNYNKRVYIGKIRKNDCFLNDVLKQKRILDSLDFKFFISLKIGYCHGDLSQDNILFDKNGFRAIVDFELANVSFILRDIARIFLTFCLDKNGIVNKKLYYNLMNGYNTLNFITRDDLINGLKILWCLEVDLWIKEEYYVDKTPDKVRKFINEINWITENWFNLENMLK